MVFPRTPRRTSPHPRRPTELSRRSLLLAGGGLTTFSLVGCGFFDTSPAGQESGSTGPKGLEAPSLADRVEAGELPPVEERLPENPMVVEPFKQMGQYGGTWRSAMITEEDRTWLTHSIGYEPLIRWVPDWTGEPGTDEIIPNVCQSFEELEGGRVFQFTLREGMKWSDGEPLTDEDFRFAFEDVGLDEELHPGGVYALYTHPSDPTKPARFESDGTVIRYVFDEPKPGFLEELATGVKLALPKHHLGQFHPLHNSDVQELVDEAGFNDWTQLWEQMIEDFADVDMPTLNAWTLTAAIGDGIYVRAERNPYYWKVDPEGSQLPYIDDIRCEVIQDVQVQLLKITNGELDMQMRNFDTIQNLPVVMDGREQGDYRLFSVAPQGPNAMVIGFNQTHEDDRLRAIYANKDFRIGLSHAIDRQRVIDTVYSGQTEPWQCAPTADHPIYDEEFATQYLEYSEDLANEALDRAGYADRDGDGYRIADGERITVTVLVPTSFPDHIEALELIEQDWAVVGVNTNISPVAEALYWERVEANMAEATTWMGGDFEMRPTSGGNHFYVPTNPRGSSRYGNRWALWQSGQISEEPPADIKRQLELFDRLRNTYEAEDAEELAREILDISKERFFYIGICTEPDSYGVARNNLENVPDEIPGKVAFQPPGPTNPEQYFFTG